jgi:hypothetical protein
MAKLRTAHIIALLALVFGLAITVDANASCTGSGPTWTSTADQTSVTTCISNASSGDTINVAAGSASWSAITITKAIHLMGAGVGNTIITQSGALSYIPVLTDVNKVFELAGFTFQGNSTHFDETGWARIPPITGLKVHDNAFNGTAGGRAVYLAGLEFGVFYNNTFSNNNIAVSVIGAGAANGNFYPLCLGCSSYPYFEDNTFGNGTGSFVFETGQGGRIAFRHNTITGYSCSGCEVFDMHGEQNSGGWTPSTELYHNTIGASSPTYRWTHHRGGQAIIFNNTISTNLSFNFTEYQSWGGNGICNAYPIAYNSSEAYCPISGICLEAQIHNTFYFNNVANGSQQTPSFTNGDATGSCGSTHESQYIQQNREFWLPTFGLESALPATCTANGNTYYGTTDTDRIFKCTATNTWSVFYQPYTYPHPLRTGSGTGSPPASPTNLTVVVN